MTALTATSKAGWSLIPGTIAAAKRRSFLHLSLTFSEGGLGLLPRGSQDAAVIADQVTFDDDIEERFVKEYRYDRRG